MTDLVKMKLAIDQHMNAAIYASRWFSITAFTALGFMIARIFLLQDDQLFIDGIYSILMTGFGIFAGWKCFVYTMEINAVRILSKSYGKAIDETVNHDTDH